MWQFTFLFKYFLNITTFFFLNVSIYIFAEDIINGTELHVFETTPNWFLFLQNYRDLRIFQMCSHIFSGIFRYIWIFSGTSRHFVQAVKCLTNPVKRFQVFSLFRIPIRSTIEELHGDTPTLYYFLCWWKYLNISKGNEYFVNQNLVSDMLLLFIRVFLKTF